MREASRALHRSGGALLPRLLTVSALLGAAGCGTDTLPDRAGDGGEVAELAALVRESVTREGLEEQTRAIVGYERPSGSAGENAAIDHIVATLEADGVPVEVHEFQAYASDPLTASVEVPAAALTLEAITVSFSGSTAGLEAPLLDLGPLDSLPPLESGTGERLAVAGEATSGGPDLSRYATVRGAVALVDGLPRNGPVAVLGRLGAVGVVFVNPEERLNELIVTSTWGTPSLLSHHRLPNLPVAQVRRGDGEALRSLLAGGGVRVRLRTAASTGWKPLRVAVARIPGPTPDGPYVLFGGHIDAWHHGANDEGASNAAMVELARSFHANRDRLRRGLVVAWWPGHSNARYAGSTWFADRFFDEMRSRALAYVNIDGIGQSGANRYGAAATAALEGVAQAAVQRRTGQSIRPRPPGRNSDQSFNGVGVPLLQISHGGEYAWWHTEDDVIEKVDWDVLKGDADLYAEALAHLLAAPIYPVDLEAQVAVLGEAVSLHRQRVGERFDLGEVAARQERLREAVRELVGDLPAEGGPALDLALVRVLRPLHRVLFVPVTPWHPDPGLEADPLPGLAATRVLAEAEPESDRYRFAEAGLVRERNRLLEALDEALAEVRRLSGSLER
jgi:Iap family predicted aminopeptidase